MRERPAIEISVLRISPNGKYLEFIITCPVRYHFSDFIIEIGENKYSVSESLGFSVLGDVDHSQGAIRLSDLGVEEPTILKVHLEATRDLAECEWVNGLYKSKDGYYAENGYLFNKYGYKVVSNPGIASTVYTYDPLLDVVKYLATVEGKTVVVTKKPSEIPNIYIDNNGLVYIVPSPTYIEAEECEYTPDCECKYEPEVIEADSIISDVSNVYNCLINNIEAFDECGASDIQDKIIRDYLMLYAHLEAMHLGYMEEAQRWFDKLKKCGTNCGPTGGCKTPATRDNHARPQSSCGCGR